ncbi:hypothetical protein AAHB33_18860 [Paenarthrobacter sp. S56]|uniref:hypothetical protein n=1 Tax=Paenarthrobacter sp. S56 TaxID=3138179 RepID=UPI00321B71C0
MAIPDREDVQRQGFRRAFEASGLAIDPIWMSYFSIGGMSGMVEVQAYVYGALSLPELERDLLAHALNECLDACGREGLRAIYSHEIAGEDGSGPAG